MMLELKDICKIYNQGSHDVPALKNISLSVKEGEYVAIMGPSGSGKTTLMNVIGCLDTPTSGQYFFEGADIARISEGKMSELRLNSIGFVFQSFHLMPRQTALDNVALPLLYAGVSVKERRAIAAKALERVGLGDRMNFKPTQLSGGQCQRVAIARAMVNNPKLLLADEPTGALDTASGQQILELFERLNREGVTIIMITHEHEVAAKAGRVLYIRDGALVDRNGDPLLNGEQFAAEDPVFVAPGKPVLPGRPEFSGRRKYTAADGISARSFISEPIDPYRTGSVDIPENYYESGYAEDEDDGYVDIEAIAEESFELENDAPAEEVYDAPEEIFEETPAEEIYFEEAPAEDEAYETDTYEAEPAEVFEIEDIPVFDIEPEDEYTEEAEEYAEPEEYVELEEAELEIIDEPEAEELEEVEIEAIEISEPEPAEPEAPEVAEPTEPEIPETEELEEPEDEQKIMDDELSALLGGNAVDPADVDFPEEFLQDDESEEEPEPEDEPVPEEAEEEISEPEEAAEQELTEESEAEEYAEEVYEEAAEPEAYEELEETAEPEEITEPEVYEPEVEEEDDLPPLLDVLPDKDEPAPAQLSFDVWGYDDEEDYISIEDIPVEGFEYEESSEAYTEEYSEEYSEEYTEQYTEEHNGEYAAEYGGEYTEPAEEYTEGYEEAYGENYESEAYAEAYTELPYEEPEEITEEETAPFSIDIDLSAAFSARKDGAENYGADPFDPNERKGDNE